MISRTTAVMLAFVALMATLTAAFQAPLPSVLLHGSNLMIQRQTMTMTTTTALSVFGKKKKKEDLSFIETRDMTREEMKQLNAENEKVMNAELVGMTVFSLIISLPLLYLAWVGLFSETAEIAMDLSEIQ